MLTKNEIKYIQSLKDKKIRESENVFVVEGIKLVEELLQSDMEIMGLYFEKEFKVNPGKILKNNILHPISHAELERISHLKTPNQVLAIVRKKESKTDYSKGIHLVLDGIQDPGNLGTIIRIADWFGISSIIASVDTVDQYNPKVVQATMGSIFRIDVSYKELETFLSKTALPIYGTLLNGKSIIGHSKIHDGLIIIGNESKGIRESVLPFVQKPITIPSYGRAESLNAGVATGIVVSHLVEY